MTDWSTQRIKAAIHKTGTSCLQLSVDHGFNPHAIAKMFKQPWPALELVVARHIGTAPHLIWPSRYDADGVPLSGGWAYPNRRTGEAHRQKQSAA